MNECFILLLPELILCGEWEIPSCCVIVVMVVMMVMMLVKVMVLMSDSERRTWGGLRFGKYVPVTSRLDVGAKWSWRQGAVLCAWSKPFAVGALEVTMCCVLQVCWLTQWRRMLAMQSAGPFLFPHWFTFHGVNAALSCHHRVVLRSWVRLVRRGFCKI